MQVQGNWVYIDSPKGQIKFHKDLKKYFEILSYFDVQRLELEKLISKVISASGAQDAANKTASALFTVTSGYILPELSKYGIYNLTVDDFVTANPGLQQIFDASNALSEYRSAQKDTYSTWANREKDKAEAVAGRTVTGPSFGIITNDWTDLMAYNFASSLIVASQTARAQKQFNSQANQIDMAAQTQVDIAVAGKVQSSFIPQATEGLNQGFQFIISKFCEQLSSVGQIDLVCLQGIDKKRSDAVLKNLEYIPDKDAVVFQAIQLCPYNLNCYFAVFHDNLQFLTYDGETARYFGLDKPLSRYLQENYRHDAANMVQGYQENCSAIEAVGYFENKPLALVARDALTVDFQRLLTLHCILGGYVKDGQPLYVLLKERYPDTSKLVEYKGKLSDDLYAESSQFTTQVLTFCSERCSIDVFASLSLWFGREIHSFVEVQGIILNKWQKEWEKIQAEREEEQRAKWQQEETDKAIKHKAHRNVCIVAAVLLLTTAASCVVARTVIIPSRKYSAAMEALSQGDYVNAYDAFRQLDEYKDSEQKIAYVIQHINNSDISAGTTHTVGLKNDGTVVSVGNNEDGQCNVSDWNNIIAIDAGSTDTIGLKSDGTVISTGFRPGISKWSDIIAVSAGPWHTVGIKANGTVISDGMNTSDGRCDVSDWSNIIAISAGLWHTAGLKSDGTVVATGDNTYGQCDVSDWRDIISISAGYEHTIGLKADGSVVAAGYGCNGNGEQNLLSGITGKNSIIFDNRSDVSGWCDMIEVSAGDRHTVGLKADGTVIAIGDNSFGQCNVSSWNNIVEISAGDRYTVGLKSDGTVVATGRNEHGECNTDGWNNIKVPESK